MDREIINFKEILGHDELLVAEFFKGYGSQSMSLNAIGVPNKVVVGSEIDPDAIISYASARHTQEELNQKIDLSDDEIKKWLIARNIGWDFLKKKSSIPRMKKAKLHMLYNACILDNEMGDISILNPNSLPNFDLMTYSFPCFVAGTLIMTDKGYKKIEDINDSDYVLTHTNTYKKVVKPMINKTDKLLKIRNMGSEDLYVTENHPFYIRERCREWNNEKRTYDRKFKNPTWVEAKDLTKDTYLGIAINQKSELPKWDGYYNEWFTNKFTKKKKVHYTKILSEKFKDKDFWWIIGRYIGDGWLVNDSGYIICCAFSELNEITDVYDRLGFKYTVTKDRTAYKVQVSMREMNEYLKQFGKGAKNKHLTSDIFNLPVDLLEGFIDGYMSADGSFTEGLYKASSISRELIHGIGQCVAKVYKTPFQIGYVKRKETCNIEGRIAKQNPAYSIAYKKDKRKQDKAFYDNGYIWCPISSIEEINKNTFVYNMQVEEDNSYTANGIIVHNCTDISVAGKQCGLIKGQTRSGLLWECEKIIAEKKPKYLLMENVKNLVGKKFKTDFDKWCEWLETQGYTNYWQVMNAKDYGIPQNRERVFMVSILGEHDTYKFPQKQELKLRLKDVLEAEVDEKYYIDNDASNRLLMALQEKGYTKNIVGIANNPDSREYTDFKECSPTLCARDYKDPKIVQTICEQRSDDEIKPNRLGNIYVENFGTGYAGNVWDRNSISPTLTTMQGGGREPLICEQRSDEGSRFLKDNVCGTLRTIDACGDKRVVEQSQFTYSELNEPLGLDEQNKYIRKDGCVGTLTTDGSSPKHNNRVIYPNYRIRKLTPKECWRLMGVDDEIFDKVCKSGISNSQLYKQAGNSIVRNCLDEIFLQLFFKNTNF